MNVLITDVFGPAAIQRLRSEGHAVQLSREVNPSEVELAKCEILLIRSRTRVTADLLAKAPDLKLIVSATSGFDHIDHLACEKKGVVATFTPEANTQSAAELTILLMLSWMRRLPLVLNKMAKSQWRDDDLRGETLAGKHLGLMGLGRIGRRVARAARALGMTVSAHDPYVDERVFSQEGVERLGFAEILISSDVISLHVPLTSETYRLINRGTLESTNHDAVLINASRGAVVDEGEVALALVEGRLRGAALDVFEREPLIKESKLRTTNTVLTPHIGAFTQEALENASLEAVNKVLLFLQGQNVPDRLPLNVPWFRLIPHLQNDSTRL